MPLRSRTRKVLPPGMSRTEPFDDLAGQLVGAAGRGAGASAARRDGLADGREARVDERAGEQHGGGQRDDKAGTALACRVHRVRFSMADCSGGRAPQNRADGRAECRTSGSVPLSAEAAPALTHVNCGRDAKPSGWSCVLKGETTMRVRIQSTERNAPPRWPVSSWNPPPARAARHRCGGARDRTLRRRRGGRALRRAASPRFGGPERPRAVHVRVWLRLGGRRLGVGRVPALRHVPGLVGTRPPAGAVYTTGRCPGGSSAPS